MSTKHNIKISKILIGVAVSLVAILAVAVVPVDKAYAADCNGTKTFFDWGCDSGRNGIQALLFSIIRWMSVGVVIAVVGGVIYGAIMYTTAGGKPDQAKKGTKIIIGALIALMLFFAMYALLDFLMPAGAPI